MPATSGLKGSKAAAARTRAVRAADLALRHAPSVHYTQGARRWDGIRLNLWQSKGQYPHYADCSAFVTWCLWNALHGHTKGSPDIVNGANWQAGFTGTLLEHGKVIKEPGLIGDVVIYGGGTGEHTALYVGGGKVISHGSEAGPFLLPVNYRSDEKRYRRYI